MVIFNGMKWDTGSSLGSASASLCAVGNSFRVILVLQDQHPCAFETHSICHTSKQACSSAVILEEKKVGNDSSLGSASASLCVVGNSIRANSNTIRETLSCA